MVAYHPKSAILSSHSFLPSVEKTLAWNRLRMQMFRNIATRSAEMWETCVNRDVLHVDWSLLKNHLTICDDDDENKDR